MLLKLFQHGWPWHAGISSYTLWEGLRSLIICPELRPATVWSGVFEEVVREEKKRRKKKAKIVLSVCATLCFRSSWHQQTQHDSIARKHPGCSVIRKKWWCYCNCMTFKSLRFQEKRVTYVRIQKKKIISSWTESRNKLDPGLHQCLSINPPNVKHCKKEKKKICIETLLCPSNLVLK